MVLVEQDHVVVALDGSDSADLLAGRFGSAIAARRTDANPPPASLRYGISGPVLSADRLSAAYNEAIVALQASSVDPGLGSHRYEDVGFYRYAAQLRSTQADEQLDRLAAQDSGNLAMLERIFDSDAPMQAVAADLHMHRTSLYNRIQRIRTVLGADPLSASVRLQLHTGLKLRRWSHRPTFDLHLSWQSLHLEDR
jgi:sugar diacid utilization regulator